MDDTLQRIHSALEAAREVLNRFTPGAIETEYKVGHDPVTEADRAVDDVLKKNLLRDGEGWLSEETVDDFRVSTSSACGLSIPSTVHASLFRVFRNSAFQLQWLRTESPSRGEFAIRRPTN